MTEDALLRAVVDTNLLISALIVERGNPFQVVEQWRMGRFLMVTSAPLSDELAGVLQRPAIAKRITAAQAEGILALIQRHAEWVTPGLEMPLSVRDPKDEVVVATALAARADYIVTGDADLLTLNGDARLGTLKIVTPVRFLEQLARPGG